MTVKNKITIILPYFGKLPLVAKYYFEGCKLNPEVDFLFFTDQQINFDLPSNVRFIPFNLKSFNKLASEKLNVEIKIKYPYKLCDFKPIYGKIFEEFIGESIFWGYTDLDMLIGRIGAFVSPETLENFDIITARENSFAGNFTLFRNTREINSLYLQADNWKNIVLNLNFVHSFPEKFKERGRPAGRSLLFKLRNINKQGKLKRLNVNDLNEIAEKRDDLRVCFGDFVLSDEYLKNRAIKNWKVVWEKDGFREIQTGKRALYFHFYRIKKIARNEHINFSESGELSQVEITQKLF